MNKNMAHWNLSLITETIKILKWKFELKITYQKVGWILYMLFSVMNLYEAVKCKTKVDAFAWLNIYKFYIIIIIKYIKILNFFIITEHY